jgi:hypothetical protein
MKKYAATEFINLEHVRDQPRKENIIDVIPEGSYKKPVLKFASGTQFSLNGTNVGIMIKEFGDEDDDWVGCTIELYAGKLKYNGALQDSVLIRAVSLPAPGKKPERAPPAPEDKSGFDDEVPF